MKKIRLLTTVAMIVALLLANASPALAFPPLPSSFYGTVKVDGVNVPLGTVISAWINGVQYASYAATLSGSDTIYTFSVPGDDPATTPAIEGGAEGNTIVFHIGDLVAVQTGIWHSGVNTRLDLTSPGYTLTVTSAHGTVTKSPDDTYYHYGEIVQLTAVPDTGWSFVNWSGDASGSTNPVNVTINGNKSVTANYAVVGVTVTPTSGLVVTEAGGTATFTVVLNTQPTANVVIGLSSSDTTEGTVAPTSLTFTTGNWTTPQTVTITGVDDAIDDGNVGFTIVTAPAVSADSGYNNYDASDVSVTNQDNDTAGITVTPTSGLVVTEAGGTATFTVVLTSQPTANVIIGLSSSDTTEGTVSPASLTFTSGNWNTAQTITVTGVDDHLIDGTVGFTIVTAAATSTDSSYNGMNAADVSVSCTDNDTAGITVNPTSLTVTEAAGAGHTATFTVVLTAQPTADVTIGLSSSDTSEGTVAPTSLTFTSANWDTAQTVTVTGVDDAVDDGNISFNIVTAAAVSTDSNFNGVNAADVSVSCTDDDTAGVTITPTSLTVTEAAGVGHTATFTVVLTSQPTANVVIGLSSSDTSEGTVSPASLTFTSANWNTAQTVTVTGVDDAVDDGNVSFSIVTAAVVSTDPNYSGMAVVDVTASCIDDDTAGITINPTSLTVTEAAGAGHTATFTVVLTSQPTADVTIGLSSSDTSEGTVAPTSLTFTSANWNTAQTVTVTGVDDQVDDGNISFSIVTAAAVSTDGSYSGMNAVDVSVSCTDDDTAGITVNPTSLTVTEAAGAGHTATFTVVLTSQPTADVTIGLSSSDTTEGTVSPTSLTFTSANWNTAQTVTVTGVDDFLDDGDIVFSINTAAAVSSDSIYSGMNAADVSVTCTDNDTAGITVNPTSGLVVTEAGGTATFTVVLNSQPTANVTIGLSSSDTTEGTVAPTSLTFTSANWNAPQTVTITGVDDAIMDGTVGFTIVTAAATSTDSNYSGMNAADVSVSCTDNDTAGITVNPTSLTVTEAAGTGHTATFTVVLNTQPTADVTIGLTSSDTTEGTVAPASLTFTNANWSTPQTVTVTGVDDFVDDGDITFTIFTAAAVSTDPNYTGMNAADVSVTCTDNDTAGITVNPTSGLVVTEAGGTATFTVVLTSQPTANVVIGLSSSDTTEGTVAPTSLTFTIANWSTPQTVTVTGVNDFVDDGNILFTIITAAATSADTIYSGMNAADVSVSCTDDDTAGITVNPTSGLVVTEAGGTATFTVVLTSQPTADVTIGLSSSDTSEGTVAPTSLAFTSVNWSTPQTVTVTGVNDFVDDGDVLFTILTAAATSADTGYTGMNAADVSVTCTDDDTAGITVTPTSGLVVTEAGGTATFTVVLNSQPTADVTLGLSSSDTSEGTVSPISLTFTSANWNVTQTVTITGVDDFVDDGDIVFNIITAAAVSTDTNYNGMNAADVSVTNTDNDTAGITVNPTSGLVVTEAGGTATFTVVLNSQPTADVTIGLSSSDTTEGTVAPTSLTFTAANWNTPQTVTVTGVDDTIADGSILFTILTAAATSADPMYNGMNPADVSVSCTDNDTPGITVTPTSGLTVTEAAGVGHTATFTVVLNTQPAADVTIGLSSSDISEGTVSPESLTFTSANWNEPQTVTITGVDDDLADGDIAFTILTAAAVSTDAGYSGLNAADVSVTNLDDDYTLTIISLHGTVVKSPDQATYHIGDVVQLTATPDATWVFVDWSGDATGTDNPISITITGNMTVTANYFQFTLFLPMIQR